MGREDPLEKEMATHSSILAWEIPWTEEPGGLQSKGLQSDTTYRSAKHIGGGRLSDTPDSSKWGPPIPEGLDMQGFRVPPQMPPIVVEAGKSLLTSSLEPENHSSRLQCIIYRAEGEQRGEGT